MPKRQLSPLIFIDPSVETSLQDQLRQRLTDAAVSGAFPPTRRLPSSRALAGKLGVARNTVLSAYQKMIDEGLLISRERSGVYVNPALLKGRVQGSPIVGIARGPAAAVTWGHRLKVREAGRQGPRRPPQWRQYPYPFLDGLFDESLFPVNDWRDAMKNALSVSQINAWSVDSGDADDPMLIEEIRTKILPRRGISARPDEILITEGSQQALGLLTALLVDKSVTVAVEEPGYPDLRRLIARQSGHMIHQPVDAEGMVVDDSLVPCQVICVTPSHQYPTGVTLSLARRQALLAMAATRDQIIIEDDFACETTYLETPLPALYSLNGGQRVIYVSGLTKVLSPGLRLGFMVAPPEVIAEARALRRLTTRHPAMNIQRASAHFLAMGYYDATMIRIGQLFRERRMALRDALNHYLHNIVTIVPLRGGTTYWVQGPPGLDVDDLVALAESHGVLIESAAPYYARPDAPKNEFLIGATSLPEERIREGIRVLRDCIRQLLHDETAKAQPGKTFGDDVSLRAALSGCVLLYKTVYGDPCTIDVLPDGRLIGRAGYANEDCDTGRWWIADGKWCRQWQGWAYGEPATYSVLLEGGRIHWLNGEGKVVDSAIYVRPEAASA